MPIKCVSSFANNNNDELLSYSIVSRFEPHLTSAKTLSKQMAINQQKTMVFSVRQFSKYESLTVKTTLRCHQQPLYVHSRGNIRNSYSNTLEFTVKRKQWSRKCIHTSLSTYILHSHKSIGYKISMNRFFLNVACRNDVIANCAIACRIR